MDRILLDRAVELHQEVLIEGPLLEALRFQRARKGSLITLTDLQGRDFRGRVVRLSERESSVLVYEVFDSRTESPIEIILLQALPKKERMEWIIQKATELGVCAIIPFQSERSILLEERETKQRKAHRWQEIARKAVQQSRRARVPWVGERRSFEEALMDCRREGLKLISWEKKGDHLKDILTRFPRQRIFVMVGPEGGFTEEEVERARREGFIPVKLGGRILRTETAAITLVGILQYELGDLS